MSAVKLPVYRRHKARDQAYVYLDGRQVYLGKFDSAASHERYKRIIAKLCADAPPICIANGSGHPAADVTVTEMALAYWRHAERRHKNLSRIRCAIRVLRENYGNVEAAKFGPLALLSLQEMLATKGRARSYIADLIAQIRAAFKWAVSRELVAPSVYQALLTVEGLRPGEAIDRPPIGPVDDNVVEATLPELLPVLADMVRLQRLLGCRPGEVCQLRPADLDRTSDVWVYTPRTHKTQHHGKQRLIFIGPRAQAVLLPYLLRDAETECFQTRGRKAFGKDGYRRAVARACDRLDERLRKERTDAGEHVDADERLFPRWHPNQLRHARATEIRKQFGLEGASTVLGHSRMDTSQIYAAKNFAQAAEIMRQIG